MKKPTKEPTKKKFYTLQLYGEDTTTVEFELSDRSAAFLKRVVENINRSAKGHSYAPTASLFCGDERIV